MCAATTVLKLFFKAFFHYLRSCHSASKKAAEFNALFLWTSLRDLQQFLNLPASLSWLPSASSSPSPKPAAALSKAPSRNERWLILQTDAVVCWLTVQSTELFPHDGSLNEQDCFGFSLMLVVRVPAVPTLRGKGNG